MKIHLFYYLSGEWGNNSCTEREKILFNYAPKSWFLVSIEVDAER